MASTYPSMISDPEEKKWVGDIEEILNHLLEIKDETPHVCVCQLPKTITTKKPEAYEPQHVGLGPIHHFRPQTYKKMEQKKLDAVRKVLQDHEIKDCKVTVVDRVRKLVPIVRSCYDMFLQGDDDSLAWIFAIDGLFLLNLFENYQKVDPRRLLAQDIMMVENQIPFMVLEEIKLALHRTSDMAVHPIFIFESFCINHSPLGLCLPSLVPASVEHMLHYMYYSIVNNIQGAEQKYPVELSSQAAATGPSNVYVFIDKVPKIVVQLFQQTISALETFTESKTLIPSASKLHDKVRISFSPVKFFKVTTRQNCIYLPPLTLNSDSEVILRNLIAYEALITNSDNSPLTEYMGLMCALIVNVEDAKYLREKGVIKGELENEEVVQLFTGMSNSIIMKKTKKKPRLEGLINQVNKVYEERLIDEVNKVYEERLMVKLHLLLKKLARWLLVGLRAIGGFVERSWKIVAFMVSIVTVFMLTWNAYCDVFGCDKTTISLLPYASR